METEPVKFNCRCGNSVYSHATGRVVCSRCTIEMVRESETDAILRAMKQRRESISSGPFANCHQP